MLIHQSHLHTIGDPQEVLKKYYELG